MNSEPIEPKPRIVKQVIVMRKDLKMRRGKEISQGSHAAMAWMIPFVVGHGRPLTEAESLWANGIFTKVTCQVNSQAELMAVHDAAKAAGLTVHLITDSGLTEFHGVPTPTCLAIGPHWSDEVDPVTGHLPLY